VSREQRYRKNLTCVRYNYEILKYITKKSFARQRRIVAYIKQKNRLEKTTRRRKSKEI